MPNPAINVSNFATAVPTNTSEYHQAGEVLNVPDPDQGGIVQWVCTDSGRPGTWAVSQTLQQAPLYNVTVSISNAEILALRATPKTLVAAPGAGKIIRFEGATLFHDYATAQFESTGDDDNLAVRYASETTNLSDTIEANGFLTATIAGDVATSAVPVKDAITLKADCENKALVLANTGGHELTTGGGTMRVNVSYRIIDTGF
jgi:hypothetical protein